MKIKPIGLLWLCLLIISCSAWNKKSKHSEIHAKWKLLAIKHECPDSINTIFLDFKASGSLNGMLVCNLIKGSYEINNKGGVKFNNLNLTYKTCASYCLEKLITSNLYQVNYYSIKQDTLRFYNDSDLKMTFIKS
jgi:heat shock protein HslJ